MKSLIIPFFAFASISFGSALRSTPAKVSAVDDAKALLLNGGMGWTGKLDSNFATAYFTASFNEFEGDLYMDMRLDKGTESGDPTACRMEKFTIGP